MVPDRHLLGPGAEVTVIPSRQAGIRRCDRCLLVFPDPGITDQIRKFRSSLQSELHPQRPLTKAHVGRKITSPHTTNGCLHIEMGLTLKSRDLFLGKGGVEGV